MKSLSSNDVKTELLQRLENLSPESKGRWGRMTVNQMLCHLSDAFIVLQKGTNTPKTPSIAKKLQFSVMRSVALYSGLPFPRSLPTLAAADQEQRGTPPTNLKNDMEIFINTMEAFSDKNRSYENCFHPILGTLNPEQWQRWGYLHIDHHFKQFGV